MVTDVAFCDDVVMLVPMPRKYAFVNLHYCV